MRKMIVAVTALLMTAYFTPAMAAGDNPTVGSSDQVLIAAKGKKRRGVRKAPKPGLEDTVRRIVDEAMRDKGKGEWSYMAKRMRPPKSNKWRARWDEIGAKGWDLVGQNENVYIFKRPAYLASTDPMPVKTKAAKPAKVKEEKPKKEKKEKKAK